MKMSVVAMKVEHSQVWDLVGEDKKQHGGGHRSEFWWVKNGI